VTSFTPTSGTVGSTVFVTGAGFTGVSRVTFNGTPATFMSSGSTFLSARVPAGATSGPITVTTPGGTVRSASSFTVR